MHQEIESINNNRLGCWHNQAYSIILTYYYSDFIPFITVMVPCCCAREGHMGFMNVIRTDNAKVVKYGCICVLFIYTIYI